MLRIRMESFTVGFLAGGATLALASKDVLTDRRALLYQVRQHVEDLNTRLEDLQTSLYKIEQSLALRKRHDSLQDRKLLTCATHNTGFEEWKLSMENATFIKKVRDFGLESIGRYTYRNVDRALLSAVVERWQPETCIFHFKLSEMTITLDDVKQIIDVPIEGEAVVTLDTMSHRAVDVETALKWVIEYLGVTVDDAREMFKDKKVILPLKWLREKYMMKSLESADDAYIECCVRAYLLHPFGTVLFVDKTGPSVPVYYLQVLHDLKKKICLGGLAF